ncbi:MAG: bifunctional UDP-sugar hydrolase/5'-nucleotidase [bacterium]|nr:bifunctional UDP-sugar hydrolase/5'-nucleotidase [bacterium]
MAVAEKHLKKLTILHSNDLHGDFLSEKIDKKLLGGASRLSGYVNKVRAQNKNTLYAIAGDMFRGSVIDSEFKGISTIDIMNLLAPDVVSLGNHEIDYGIAHLVFLEKCAKFPIVNANLYIKTTKTRLFNSHKILKVDGMKIMFIGILTQEIMANAKSDQLLGTFVDVEQAAAAVGKICNNYRTQDIDLTVVLTHIGFAADKKLAKLLNPKWGVDIIIGGHSHTFLKKAARVNNVLIAQAGVGTDQIGRFDMEVNTDTNSIDSYTWKTIPINAAHCPRDVDLENTILKYKKETDRKYGRLLTKFVRPLTHPVRNQETELGNLFADILQSSFGVDLVFVGSGSIRGEKLGPVVKYGDLVEIFPYDDDIYSLEMTGKQLYQVFTHLLRDKAFTGETEYYQISKNWQVTYDKKAKKIVDLTFKNKTVDLRKKYSVALQKFHFNNLSDFLGVSLKEVEVNKKPRIISTSALDIFDEYLTLNTHLDARIEGRYNFI